MITSDFSLEYIFSPPQCSSAPEPNRQRLPLPPQLQRLHVREEEWTSIYDYGHGVAKRANDREVIKRQLDASLAQQFAGVTLVTSKKREQKRQEREAEIAAQKKEHDASTKKGWKVLLDKCNSTLGTYGVRAFGIVQDGMAIGIDFRCDYSKLRPNKLELRYCTRRKVLSWPREKVPDELAALHVDATSWMSVWDNTKVTVQRVLALEEKKKAVQRKINGIESGISVWNGDLHDARAVTSAIQLSTRFVEEKLNIKSEQELEFYRLIDFAEDTLFPWGVHTRLMRDAGALELGYCGLVLRFQPIVATSAVPAVAVASAPPME